MKRTTTLTLPYSFCLFCGVGAVVLTMAGTVAWLGHRDMHAARPDQAAAQLHGAIAPVTEAMRLHFGPARDELDTITGWAASGTLREKAMLQWPALLLPALSHIEAIRSVQIAKENGAHWLFERSGDGWLGTLFDPVSDEGAANQWHFDTSGICGPVMDAAPVPADPRLTGWYREAVACASSPADAPIHAETSGAGVTLASPLRFADGQQGSVALSLDGAAILEQAAASDDVALLVDPDGARIGQLQDPHALALLRTRALPGSSNNALAALFPEQARIEAEYWYAADAYFFNDEVAWWVIGVSSTAQLPLPGLPLGRYLGWSLAAGGAGALAVALLLGRRITRPLRQVAARARSIQVIDEHYLPWPRSRFTEVNVLTAALEDIYEAAVEHLDYHDAPLVVWGSHDDMDSGGAIDTEAVRHVMDIPRGNGAPKETEAPSGPVIDAVGAGGLLPLRDPSAAAQIQALQGTRREVRRLQGQLAGANEELRSTDSRHRQDQVRIKRQRTCLRGLERILLSEGGASPTMLAQVREILGASHVSVWIGGRDAGAFFLRGASGENAAVATPLEVSFNFVALLQAESVVAVQEGGADPRLKELSSHPFFSGPEASRLLAPIKFVGRLLGFIVAERPAMRPRWKGDEEIFVMGVAAACAGVVCQQLRQRTERKAEGAAPPNGNGGNGGGLHARIRIESAAIYWETDLAGCITSIDGDVESVYGRDAGQLIGQPITFLSDEENGQRDMRRLRGLLSGERCRGYETRHCRADGGLVPLVVRAKVRRDAHDHIVGARGTLERVSAAAVS